MIIPHQKISPEALRSLVEEFVTRDGTDYGGNETSLEQKTQQVLAQLDRGKVVILFDTGTETCTIVNKEVIDSFES